MSRGLGKMQRAILERLQTRQGGDWWPAERAARRGRLAPDIHDLRRVTKEIGTRSHCDYLTEEWQASFSRAVAGLQRRGLIEFPSLVPLAEADAGFAHDLADGLYRFGPRQRRFARLLPQTAIIHNT